MNDWFDEAQDAAVGRSEPSAEDLRQVEVGE